MNWKKILSLLIVSVLVIGGLTVIAGHTRAQDDGELISEVNFDVVLDMEDGVVAAYEGDIHLFMHGVDGVRYNELDEEWRIALETWDVLGSYNNLLLNPAYEGSGTEAMDEAVAEGWVDDPEDIRWLANNADGDWTVNPFAHEDIRFALQYINREAIIEDLLDGFGVPRYGFMRAGIDTWEDYYVDAINDHFDLGPDGDEDYMEQWIQTAMEEIQEEAAFGEVTHEDGNWYYEHAESGTDQHQIEIVIMARSEDWRQELGDYMEEILVDQGFDAWVDPTPAGEAIPRAFFGTPEPYDNLDYHIYTGGWVSTATVAYQHAACSQMYAPWYGFLQTYGPEEHWQYDDEDYGRDIGAHEDGRGWDPGYTVEEFDLRAQDLHVGQGMEVEADYWEEQVGVTQLGFTESIRIFLTTGQDFYPYNPERLHNAVPEGTNGYDTYFGPRTMITDDGTLDTEILTGEDQPYMDNWNYYGGSADVYGEYQRRMLREWNSWLHPQDGLPMQVNNYWMDNEELEDHRPERLHPYEIQGNVTMDFEFEEGELIENIEIPEEAVDWVPAEREWLDRDDLIDAGEIEDDMAAVQVTIDVHEEHVWHDGTEYSLRDVMADYAREKSLGDDTHAPYLASWGALNSVFWNSIHAMEWNEDEGTYTVWGDYTFPVEDLIGSFYSMSQETHPLTYEGWDHLHGGEETEYGGIVDEGYLYEPEEGFNWIHQISSTQNEDLVTVLEAMRDDEWIPYYLREDAGAPMPMDEDELTTQLDSVIDFIETYEHSYIGKGPFMLENYDEEDHTLELVRWEDYGFPFDGESVEYEGDTYEFPQGYWMEQFTIAETVMDTVEVAEDELAIGEEIEATGTGFWQESFPQEIQRALTEDELREYRYVLYDEDGDAVVTVGRDNVTLTPEDGFSTFEANIPTDEVEVGGTYTVSLEGQSVVEPEDHWSTAETTVTLFEAVWDVTITQPEFGEEFEEEDDVEIEYDIESEFDDVRDVELTIEDEDGEEVYSVVLEEALELDDGDTFSGDYTWEADEAGEYTIRVSAGDDFDEVDITVDEEDVEEVPGFTIALLILGAVIAVAIYSKKKN